MKVAKEKKHVSKVPYFSWFLTSLILGILCFIGSVYFFGGRNLSTFENILGISVTSFIIPYKSYDLAFDASISTAIKDEIKKELSDMEFNGTKRFNFVAASDNKISYASSKDNNTFFNSYIVPVGHFYWVKDGIKASGLSTLKIYTVKAQQAMVKRILDDKYEGNFTVSGVDDLKAVLKVSETNGVGFVDIANLDYEYKLLTLDDKYFFDNKDGGVKYGLDFVGDIPSEIVNGARKQLLNTDVYDDKKLASINTTGVTALSRNLAIKINASGKYDYPADYVYKYLAAATLTHVSNEVSFVPGCVPTQSMKFCSHPLYIQTLEKSGVDIVELTGNHNNDYGSAHNKTTIEMYKAKAWDYFGGGLDVKDANKILIKEVNGTKVAFLGYNYYDTALGSGALATTTHAGATPFNWTKIAADIKSAKKQKALVFVSVQYQECYSYPPDGGIYPLCYRPIAAPDQKTDFRKISDLGADVVFGTQAHQPQAYEIYKGKLIYYGLGNLYFDQIPWIGTRQGLIITNYTYDGKLIQSRIVSTLYDGDMRPYITTDAKRTQLLNLLKTARPIN